MASRALARDQQKSGSTNKQQIIEVLDKLNEKDLQKIAEKVLEIKEQADESAKNGPTEEEKREEDATTQAQEDDQTQLNEERKP